MTPRPAGALSIGASSPGLPEELGDQTKRGIVTYAEVIRKGNIKLQ